MTILSRKQHYNRMSWAATSYSLFCHRISERGALESDRIRLRELGDYIGEICNNGASDYFYKEYVPTLVRGIEGLALLVEIEKKYLTNQDSKTFFAGRLRELGITSLDEFAAALKKADKPEFERYAAAFDELFTEWHGWAEELSIPCQSFNGAEKILNLMTRFPSRVKKTG